MKSDGSLLLNFRKTFHLVSAAFEQYIGWSVARGLIFVLLTDHEEISQAELVQRLGIDGAGVTRLVKQLEAEGLLTRRRDPTDNRFTLVRLTQQGHRAVEALSDKILAVEPMILEGLSTQDVACLQRALERIQRNVADIRL